MSLTSAPPRSLSTGAYLLKTKARFENTESSKSSSSEKESEELERSIYPLNNDAYEFFNLQKLESKLQVL